MTTPYRGATMMAGMGISGDVIDECLNHMIEPRGRADHIRDRRFSEQQKAFDALGRRLMALRGALRMPAALRYRGKKAHSADEVVAVGKLIWTPPLWQASC